MLLWLLACAPAPDPEPTCSGDKTNVFVISQLSFSRSGATIIGGLLFGLSRKAATEFSFFLAIPTLLMATAYQLYKERALLSLEDLDMWIVGFLSAFLSAFICVRWLLRYIAHHDFIVFAWYRVIFGLIVILSWHYQWIEWTPQ